jgi:hypothetical protein
MFLPPRKIYSNTGFGLAKLQVLLNVNLNYCKICRSILEFFHGSGQVYLRLPGQSLSTLVSYYSGSIRGRLPFWRNSYSCCPVTCLRKIPKLSLISRTLSRWSFSTGRCHYKFMRLTWWKRHFRIDLRFINVWIFIVWFPQIRSCQVLFLLALTLNLTWQQLSIRCWSVDVIFARRSEFSRFCTTLLLNIHS